MVKKGAGYALEAIVAIATVFIFVFGTLTVPANQNWSEFREQVSAEDLTYAMQKTGYINHSLRNGETGSLQTAFSTVTERDIEVSGLVSNLPINENKVAFYILESNRYEQNLEIVDDSSDPCYGDLEEIKDRSEREVLYSTDSDLKDSKNNVTYVADLDPSNASATAGDGKVNYDSIWVDNGTACQFSSAEGPYSIENIFKWEGEYYDFKSVDGQSSMMLYNATQPVEFREMLKRPVNSVETFTTVDTVNFTRLEQREYNTAVFRNESAVDDIDTSPGNRRVLEEFLQTGSILFLADLEESDFDSGKFLGDAGFEYVNVNYQGSVDWDSASARFSDGRASQEVKTYFKGLKGSTSSLSITPSAKVISNSESTLKSGRALLKSGANYDFSEWDAKTDNMDPNNSKIEGAPPSECYFDSSGNERDRALTNDTLSFPKDTYTVINAQLGTTESYCDNNDDRAVKIDLDGDGDYSDPDEGPFLNGESVIVDNRKYGIKIPPYDPGVKCDEVGGCVDFLFTGDRSVELIPRRTSFPGFEGQKIAVTGYEDSYSESDLKILTATINWLRGDRVRFTADADPGGISTTTFASIQNETYMPYELNLRWSR